MPEITIIFTFTASHQHSSDSSSREGRRSRKEEDHAIFISCLLMTILQTYI